MSPLRSSPTSKLILSIFFIGVVLSLCFGLYNWLIIWDDPIALHIEDNNIYLVEGMMVKDKEERNIHYISIERMPDHLIDAFIAMEDARFFQHSGVDYIGILRAIMVNISSQKVSQGGSTITQQLAKNLFLDHSRTVERKLMETRIALALENKFTKEEIIEMYLNQIYFGHGNWGISQAAESYFTKEVFELTLGESAVLAGIIQSPNAFAPVSGWGQAETRQNLVLERMLDLGLITEEEAEAAVREAVNW